MDLNHRRKVVINCENTLPDKLLPGKAMVGKTAITALNKGVTRRPALGDIHNKIHRQDSHEEATKKPVLFTKAQPFSTTTRTLISHRDATKVITNVIKPTTQYQTVKREESILSKKAIKPEKQVTPKKAVIVPSLKSFSSQRIEAEENNGGSDPQFVAEYVNDIFSYLRNLEEKYSVDALFLTSHRTTPRMRTVLINWLVEVHTNFHFLLETLHLCVSIVDRYLQKNKTIGRNNLQLVGIAALFIAGKYEEIYVPEICDFEYVCDNSFTRGEITRMELFIIKSLDYSFGRPNSIHFLRRYSKVGNVQPQMHMLAKYLLELALIEIELCYVKPSLQAAAAICLAMSVLGENNLSPAQVWSRTLVVCTTYAYTDLDKTIKLMAAAVVKQESSKYQAIRNKYSSASNGKISQCAELKGPLLKKLTEK